MTRTTRRPPTLSTESVQTRERVREPMSTFTLALMRPLNVERLCAELAAHLPGVIPHDGWAFGIRDAGEPEVRLEHQQGIAATADDAQRHLRASWAGAIAKGELLSREWEDAVELTVPIPGASVAIGALTVAIRGAPSDDRVDSARGALASVAEVIGAALDRIAAIRALERRERFDASTDAAGSIAQLLRSALFAMSSAAQLLRFRATEDPVIEKNVGRVLREVEQLNRVTASILEYCRPAPLTLALGDPDAIWESVLAAGRGNIEARSLVVRRSRPPHGKKIRLDAARLSEAFGHLLASATQAAPAASEVSLESTVQPDGSWLVTLRIDGSAIPATALDHMFELLFSTTIPGSGAGLALARRVIEEHGGRFWIRDAGGRTELCVVLPT